MIRPCEDDDFATIETVINEAARAYHGAIPEDCWHEPYMSAAALRREMDAGVRFWGWEQDQALVGVMGVQRVRDVTLIRHAYVRTALQGRGIGAALLSFLVRQAARPLLVGTWADATWAVAFYQRHGFRLVGPAERDRLLDAYWDVSARQKEVAVVLAYAR